MGGGGDGTCNEERDGQNTRISSGMSIYNDGSVGSDILTGENPGDSVENIVFLEIIHKILNFEIFYQILHMALSFASKFLHRPDFLLLDSRQLFRCPL